MGNETVPDGDEKEISFAVVNKDIVLPEEKKSSIKVASILRNSGYSDFETTEDTGVSKKKLSFGYKKETKIVGLGDDANSDADAEDENKESNSGVSKKKLSFGDNKETKTVGFGDDANSDADAEDENKESKTINGKSQEGQPKKALKNSILRNSGYSQTPREKALGESNKKLSFGDKKETKTVEFGDEADAEDESKDSKSQKSVSFQEPPKPSRSIKKRLSAVRFSLPSLSE